MNSDLNPDAREFVPSKPYIPSTHISEEVAHKVLEEDYTKHHAVKYSPFNSIPHYSHYDVEFRWYFPKSDSSIRAAFFQLYKDGLPLVGFNYCDIDAIEYALRGLTSTHTGLLYPSGKPMKKYYKIQAIACNICCIDDAFYAKFNNPYKRWTLRMDACSIYKGWKNIEVSIIASRPATPNPLPSSS